jgi:hypothetical protein
MTRFQPVLMSIPVLVVAALGMASGQAAAERRGLLDVLQPRMAVSLRETAGRFEIGVLEGIAAPLGHEVLDVGSDYVVIGDISGMTRRSIPVLSISCISVSKIRP